MTPVQITYFKQFMYNVGEQKMFRNKYKKFHYKENPDSIEEYMLICPYDTVLTDAFSFVPNEKNGYDYWKDLQDKWIAQWELFEDNPINKSWRQLRGPFYILRQNWDKPNCYTRENFDTVVETRFRLGMCKFKAGDIIQSMISEEVQTVVGITEEGYLLDEGTIIDFDKEKYWYKPGLPVPNVNNAIKKVETGDEVENTDIMEEAPQKEPEASNDSLEGFSAIEADNKKNKKMPKSQVSVNLRSGGYRITFSSEMSKALRETGYGSVNLLINATTKEIALVFNNTKGVKVNLKGTAKSDNKNLVINSKEMVTSICKFYGVTDSNAYFTMNITADIKKIDSTIIKLKKE